jgi:hypothetical protein
MVNFRHVVIASLVGGAVADSFNKSSCPETEWLVFNNTNVADLAPCSVFNYHCPVNGTNELMEYNSTTGPAPADCVNYGYNLAISTNSNVTGSLSIPGVATAMQAFFQGVWPWTDYSGHNMSTPGYPLNITSLELPDLVTVTNFGGFGIELADKLESLQAPKLTNITTGSINIDLSGINPPAINLSFPSLYFVQSGIFLTGNIDAVDLPVLNSTEGPINVTSSGNLDCVAFAVSVVNATSTLWTHGISPNGSVICNSKKASVTTSRASQPTSGSSGKLCVRGYMVLILGFVASICVVL